MCSAAPTVGVLSPNAIRGPGKENGGTNFGRMQYGGSGVVPMSMDKGRGPWELVIAGLMSWSSERALLYGLVE